MDYFDRLPLSSVHVVVYSMAVGGVGALGVVRFGWGLGYNSILTPFGVMVIGAGLLVLVLSAPSRVTHARVSLGVALLLLVTLSLANGLRIVGPTESDLTSVEVIADVFLWTPIGLGVLAGFVSSDRFPTTRIGNFRIGGLEWAVFGLGLLGQVAAVLLFETFILPDPPAFAGVVYTMLAVVVTIAWIASYPFYLVGRDFQ